MNLKKFLLSLGVLLCCAVASNAQAEYPDVPLDDPAYADINLFPERSVIQDCFGETGGMTRYEFSVVIARLLELSGEEAGSYPPDIAAALKRLANKFLPELKALGVDAEKINGVFLIEPKIEPVKIKIAPPFSDVPKNHWAFDAVEKLRLNAILIGYPDNVLTR